MSMAATVLVVAPALALRPATQLTRRRAAIEVMAATLATSRVLPARSADEELVKVYFGAGCFWHVQHEFVLKEAEVLQRRSTDFSAVSGYAGGAGADPKGLVCYHNSRSVGDYGRLGHAEVVQLTVPVSSLDAFASKYFGLFGSGGYRHDPQDRGGEYRSVVGLPGGIKSPLFPRVEAAAQGSPMRLVEGRGSEDDTLAAKEVLVMDSTNFPFFPAELYHQFHNDFMGPPYGKTYNRLQGALASEGRLATTGCPEEAF